MGGDDSTLTVTNSSFESNRATSLGGGFFIINDGYGDAVQHSGIFTNCRFVNNTSTTNQSSSIHYDDGNGPGIVFTNCTIYDTTTTGRAINYTKDGLGSEPKFRNTIFSINAGQDLMASPRINEVIFQNCITNKASFGNNISTLNNIVSSDPLFVDAAVGDFTLQATSPAINTGNTTLFSAGQTPDLSAITTDLRGKDRIVNSIVDMGAYEFGIGVTSVKQDVLCYNGATGSITTTVVGGTPPFFFSWDTTPVQTTQNLTNLAPGTYTLTVTDDDNLTTTHTVTITQPTSALTASAGVQVNVLCNGNATGEATVNATGGTGTYTYSWSPSGGTAATATNLTAGTYTATVTDANNCTAIQTFTITEPAALIATADTQTNVLCNSSATGEATVTATGGTGAYTYSWNTNPVQTTATATNLAAGTYTVTVTDANGCTINTSITITQSSSSLQLTTSQVNVDCATDTDGSITINATGGTGPYTYVWSPAVSTTNFADNLAIGNYNVVVTDANGCWDIRYLTLTAPNAVTGSFTVTNADCYTPGSATIHATGGLPPYTYLWSNGNTTPNLENVAPGTFTVTITDTNGCSYVLSTTIYGSTPIIVTSDPQPVTINGGETAIFTVEAQNVAYYQWQVSTDGGQTFTNLNLGGSLPTYYGVATATLTVANAYEYINGYQYRVILMQQNGCYILSEAATLTVNPVIVGVDDVKHLEMNIYPNPASGEVFVKIADFGSYGDIKLEVYDLNGRLVRTESRIPSEEYRMDVTGLESGYHNHLFRYLQDR